MIDIEVIDIVLKTLYVHKFMVLSTDFNVSKHVKWR